MSTFGGVVLILLSVLQITNIGNNITSASNMHMPCKLHEGKHLLAVTPDKDNLYLIIDEILYSLPFTISHIESYRIRLTGYHMQSHGLWNQTKLFRKGGTIHQKRRYPIKRVDLNLRPELPEVEVQVQYINNFNYPCMLFGPAQGNFRDIRIYSLHAYWNNGQKGTPKFTITLENTTRLIAFDASIFGANIKKDRFYGNLNRASVILEKTPAGPPSKQLISSSITNTLGFVFDGVVHYWNMEEKTVSVFEAPNGPEKAKMVTVISMDEYFVCSEKDWTTNRTTTSTRNSMSPETIRDSLLFLFSFLVILLLLTLVVAGFVISSRKKVNQKKRSKTEQPKYCYFPRKQYRNKSKLRQPETEISLLTSASQTKPASNRESDVSSCASSSSKRPRRSLVCGASNLSTGKGLSLKRQYGFKCQSVN